MNMHSEKTVQDEIKEQETELKELLLRVMEAPLRPVLEKIESLEEQVEAIEEQCKDTDMSISGLATKLDVDDQKRATKASFERLPVQFREVVEELVSTKLAEMSVDISRVNDSQMQSAESLGLALRLLQEGFKGTDESMAVLQTRLKEDGDRVARELQLGVARAESLVETLTQLSHEHASASQAWTQSEKERVAWEKDQSVALARCEQSIASGQARLVALQSDTKAVVVCSGDILKTVVDGFSNTGTLFEHQRIQSERDGARFADELRQSGGRIDALAPQVAQNVERLAGAVQIRLQQMQRRIFWLTAVTALSVAGTVALVIKMTL